MKIFNTQVYGLFESIIRSGYPFKNKVEEFDWFDEFRCLMARENDVDRAKRLANSPIGSGHSNFLKGIIVQMDVEASQYVWMQIERYKFFEIISSQSKMHTFKIPEGKTYEEVLDNTPMGLELTAGISTNYMCLKNMYHQRKNHRLKFWTEIFCPWVEELPMAKELIL
jgi:hypothetical protein